jgi:hypothetical protein
MNFFAITYYAHLQMTYRAPNISEYFQKEQVYILTGL